MDPDWQLASWLYCSTQGGSPGLKAKPTGLIPEFISIDHRSSSARGLGRQADSESELGPGGGRDPNLNWALI